MDNFISKDIGFKMDLLWTNPNPTSSFSATTISLDLNAYRYILAKMSFYYANTGAFNWNNLKTDTLIEKGSSAFAYGFGDHILVRQIEVTDNTIKFSVGYQLDEKVQEANTGVIPYKIYGIR